MKKLSKIFTVIALFLTLSVVATACNGKLAPFINPTDGGGDSPGGSTQNNAYVISVVSKGGLNLNGVKVSAVDANGEVKAKGITKDGKVTFSTLPLGEYELVFEDLPDGYYIENDETYYTDKDSYELTAVFTSKVISTTASSGTRYSVGDVMHDFSGADTDNNEYVLSDLLQQYKAVMLNFWYRDCAPCRSEFPSINSAYNAYKDKVKILALSYQDSIDQISEYKKEMELDFSMGFDINGRITNLFGATSFPTTVIIDRYGVVAFIESGSIPNEATWKALFEKYTSEDYIQTPGEDKEEGDIEVVERIHPNVEMPDASEFNAKISGENLSSATYSAETETADKEYSWPFLIGEDNDKFYAYASNANVEYSFATLHVTIDVKAGDTLSFEYKYETEPGVDVFYALLDDELIAEYHGSSNGWQTQENVAIFNYDQTVKLSFIYNKDAEVSAENEFVGIRNINITTFEQVTGAIDMRRDASTVKNVETGKFDNYIDYIVGEDGFFYVDDNGEKGAILLGDLVNVTPWTKLRFDTAYVEKNSEYNIEYYRVPYYISFWEFGNVSGTGTGCDDNFVYYSYDKYINENGKLEKVDYNAVVIDYYYMQMFSDNGYFPVTEEMKTLIQDFAFTYAILHNQAIHDEMWLEFCYYYEHFGEQSHGTDETGRDIKCNVDNNPALGMSVRNPIKIDTTINELKDGVTLTADIYHPLQIKRGVKYKFTAPESGAYEIKSLANTTILDPAFFIFDADYNMFDSQDECLNYDRFSTNYYYNFVYYIYLEKGETIYPTIAFHMPGETGVYDFKITYLGEKAQKLLICTTGEGAWTYDEVTGEQIYLAVEVAFDDLNGYYRQVLEDGTFGSPVYIDFIHPGFFDKNGNTIKDMIDEGVFDFSEEFGSTDADYTALMNGYYQDAIKNENELYGMHLATEELVYIVDSMMSMYQEGNSSKANAWRQVACYYGYYGPSEDYPWQI